MPTSLRRLLAGLGQVQAARQGDLRQGDLRQGVFRGLPVQRQPGVVVRSLGRRAPAVVGPGAGEGGVDRVALPAAVQDLSRCHGVRRSQPLQRDTLVGQGTLHPLVARPSVGSEVGGDVHAVGPHRAGDSRKLLHRVAVQHVQRSASGRQGRVQAAQGGGEVGAATGTGGPPEHGIDHEHREDTVPSRRRARRQQRRVVRQPQVAAEPHHGGAGLGHRLHCASRAARCVRMAG